ncbi:MAG: HAMP domain-containing histidine kinase [Lachnospiraceae bacterium]|nr:HAMP domain-containing histidine kinase [Lachnospiraceae bacterium]
MRSTTKKISLKWKIFGAFEIFAIVLIAILWIFQVVYLKDFYIYIKGIETQGVLEDAASIISDNNDVVAELSSLASSKEAAIYVTDVDGNSIYSAEYNPSSRLNSISKSDMQRFYEVAVENGGETKVEFQGHDMMERPENMPEDFKSDFIEKPEDDMMRSVIYVKVLDVDDGQYILMVNSVLSPVEATVSTLEIQLVIVTIIILLVAIALAIVSSRSISKSLTRLNGSAKKLAKGNYDVSFNEQDYTEISQLSDTLNYATNELAKTENLRRELIANVSHDLRTPLTMIKAYAEIMRDLPGENNPENVQVVIDETERLTRLVNDMLDVSKLEAGAIELERDHYNLTQSIKDVLARYNKLIEQEGYSIDFECRDEVDVYADENKMNQVIYNLVNNAINYTGDDKRVRVVQTCENGRVKIEIIDSGQGIAPKDLPYVWDRYYKVDKAHKRAVMGTGLGLSIVQKVLEMHDAAYGVDSQPGQGCDFWFELKID